MSAEPILPDDPEVSEAWFMDEVAKLQKFWRLLLELASARSWSQVQFTTCQPNAMAVVLLKNTAAAQAGLDAIKLTWDAVISAERAAASDSNVKSATRDALRAVLQDLAWNRLQPARECLLECIRGKWLVTDGGIQKQAESLFSGPANTKWELEDLFAHLASVARATNLPTAMNKPPDGLEFSFVSVVVVPTETGSSLV